MIIVKYFRKNVFKNKLTRVYDQGWDERYGEGYGI